MLTVTVTECFGWALDAWLVNSFEDKYSIAFININEETKLEIKSDFTSTALNLVRDGLKDSACLKLTPKYRSRNYYDLPLIKEYFKIEYTCPFTGTMTIL